MNLKVKKTASKPLNSIGLAVMLLLMTGCAATPEEAVTPDEAAAIAQDAYVYGFPMVMNYKTLYNYVVDISNPEYKGPFNDVACEARLFTPEDKAVVTPNADTPYCMFWMDLRAEPLVLSVPEMEPERFYHFQLIDLYSHNFAYVGTLTTGNGAGSFLIAGPDWDGQTPEGISDVIRSETEFIFNVTRTQLFGPDDMERVEEIQDAYELQPLSSFLGSEAPSGSSLPNFPVWTEGAQFDERFFGYLDFMMSLLEKPGIGEEQLWDQLAKLGIGVGNNFDYAALDLEIQEALKTGVQEGFAAIEGFVAQYSSDALVSGKIFGTRDFLTESAQTNYGLLDPSLLRSVAAHMGLYGNSAVEAIYPTYLADVDQQPLDASAHRYTITFEDGRLPPVKAFWSLTMYDGATQLFISNPLDRYLLNSTMMDQFQVAEDGSLTLYVQKDPPSKDVEANWLPAPEGPFYMAMRLYGPEAEALDGVWTPPTVVRAE